MGSVRPTVATVSQVFCEVVPPRQSSLGIWTWQVASRLADRWRPVVLARGAMSGLRRVESEGIEVELVPALPYGLWRKAASAWRCVSPLSDPLVAQPFYARDYVRSVVGRLRALQPDLIHVQNFPNHVPLLRSAMPDAAIVLHMHCDWLAQFDRRSMARAVSAADMVVGCSSHVVETAREWLGDVGVPYAVVPNGAPVNCRPGPHHRDGSKTVLFVGRLSPEKGIHTLLEAWPDVVAAHPSARLDIVGAMVATDRDMLIDLSADAEVRALARFYPGGSECAGGYAAALHRILPGRVRHTVTFAGSEPYALVQDRYRQAALLANPSLSESFGMSLVEAMAAGTPVVATRVGGMTEIVERTGAGVLVGTSDPKALAAAICRLLSDPALRGELGRRGTAAVAATYSWDIVADRTNEIYLIALERRRRSRGAIGLRNDRRARPSGRTDSRGLVE